MRSRHPGLAPGGRADAADAVWQPDPALLRDDRSGPLVRRPCRIVILALQGVMIDEAEAFRGIFQVWPGGTVIVAGRRPGPTPGAGGSVVVDVEFGEIDTADIVVVPGGLGVRQAVADETLTRWLRNVTRNARWVLASSTGSVLLAGADVLAGSDAATHWLAGDLLGSFGSAKAADRVCVRERIVTCSGAVTAITAACHVVEAELGPAAAAQARSALSLQSGAPTKRRWRRRATGAG